MGFVIVKRCPASSGSRGRCLEDVVMRVCSMLVYLPEVAVRTNCERPSCESGGAVHCHGGREAVLVNPQLFDGPSRLV